MTAGSVHASVGTGAALPDIERNDAAVTASPLVFAAGRGLAAALYALLYNFIYEVYLFPLFEYFGFRNYEDSWIVFTFGAAAVVLASMALPSRIKLPSDFCSWMIFVLIYVPATVTLAKSGTLRAGEAEVLIAALCLSQILLSTIPRFLHLKQIYFPSLRGVANPSGLSIVSLLISLVLTIRFFGVMNFAGFDDIYIQRENASVGEAGFIFGYLVLWQTYAVAPLLIAASFYTRRRIFLMPAFIGLVVVYMITAAKVALFIYLTTFLVYLLSRWQGFQRPTMFMLIAVIPLALSAIVFLLLGSTLEGPLMIGTSVIIMRGVAVQGMLTNLYAEFFATHPYTYYSHVNIISLIIDYPYADPLSTELSYFLIGHGNAGANASFWATDGIAAGGSLGVVAIGIVAGIIFSVVNACMRNVDYVFVALSLTPFVMALANVSMFTSILSAGGFMVFLLAAPLYARLREEGVHAAVQPGEPGRSCSHSDRD